MRDSLRRAVALRAEGCCEYCGWPDWFTPSPFALDHIFPSVLGGEALLENLDYCCAGCNNHKYDAISDVDPSTGQLAPLFHPRNDAWSDHFTFTRDGLRQLGLTPTGRATIQRLKLNRPEVLRMRRMIQLFPTPEQLDASSD